MEEALEKMPDGLSDAFGQTLSRLNRQSDGRKRLGIKTLMWIFFARRPLLVTELSEALAIRPRDSSLNAKYRPSQKLMVDCCQGLVVVDEGSSVFRLVHYSVQEYLDEHQDQIFPTGDQTIAEMLTTYLLFETFALGCREDESEILRLISDNILVKYAVRHWGDHVRDAHDGSADEIAYRFLEAGPQRSCACQVSQYIQGRREEYWEVDEAESRNGLHVAASFGLGSLAKRLLDCQEVKVDTETCMGTTALILAASHGHKGLIQILLSRGADVTLGNWYGTALHCAAESGKVKALLDVLPMDFDVDVRDPHGRTALHCATYGGHIAAMQALIDRGADVNATTPESNSTPLRSALKWGNRPDVISLLLANGANTDFPSHRNKRRVAMLPDGSWVTKDTIQKMMIQTALIPNPGDTT